MTTVKTPESRKQHTLLMIAQCLIAFALVIRCNSMWITLENTEDLTKKAAYAMIFLGIALAVCAVRPLQNMKQTLLAAAAVAVLAVYLILYLFITDFAHKIFLRDLIIFLALVFYYFLVEGVEQIPGVLLRYEMIVTVIAALSLLCWLAFSVARLLPPSGECMTWWNGTDHYTPVSTYFGIYFEPQTMKIFGHRMIRNCSFFTEAPMASLHFSIALLIDLLLRRKTPRIRTILLLLAIASTFSATGYVVAVIALAAKALMLIFRSERFRALSAGRKLAVRLVIAGVIVILLALCFFLIRGRVGGLSWRIREQDMRASLMAWLDRPVFGNGIYNFEAVKQHFPGSRATYAGFSCTTALGTILADGGLMFGLLYIGAVVCAVIRAVRNRDPELCVFALLVLVLFTVTIVPYDYIMLFLFLFLGAYQSRWYRRISERLSKSL